MNNPVQDLETKTNMGECVSARTVLWHITFTGFAINFMLRMNMNICIVSMVRYRYTKTNNLSLSSECINASSILVPENNSNTSLDSAIQDDELRFDWDEKQQSVILGSQFWLTWASQIPGGVLAQRYGTKVVFGMGNFIPSLLTFLIPLCARWDYRILAFIRVIIGIIAGVSLPSMHHLTAQWIPPNERSRFLISYTGNSVGVALVYPLCSLIISWFNWPMAFYVNGLIGVIWSFAWWYLVYDTPAQHPRISPSEKAYILNNLGNTVSTKKRNKIPWKQILLSRAVWLNNLTTVGHLWSTFTLMTQSPTYFRFILGWDLNMTGLLTGIPYLSRIGCALLMSYLIDHFLQNNVMTRTNVRKLATGICNIGQAVFSLGLAFSGCNSLAAAICLILAIATGGAINAGTVAGLIDIAPNYASVLMGMNTMLGMLPGVISPFLVGLLTYQNQTLGQWFLVFIISAIILLATVILYLLFGTANLQEWNSPPEEKCSQEHEKMVPEVIDTQVKNGEKSKD